MAQMVKNLPAIWETQVRSLSQEDPLEKGMATHSSVPAWRIPWTEESGGFCGVAKSRTRLGDEHTYSPILFVDVVVELLKYSTKSKSIY